MTDLNHPVTGNPVTEQKQLLTAALPETQRSTYDAVADAVQEIADAAEEAFKKAGLTDPGEWDSDNIVEDVKRGIVSAIGKMTPRSATPQITDVKPPCGYCEDPQACFGENKCWRDCAPLYTVSTSGRSREDVYRRGFVFTLAAALQGGFFNSDLEMKGRVIAYLHTATLDQEAQTCEKVLNDAMGIPTDVDRAFVSATQERSDG